MFFAETTNRCFTSERIKQSCLSNCTCLVRNQRIYWGHNADTTNAGSLHFYSGRDYTPAGTTPNSQVSVHRKGKERKGPSPILFLWADAYSMMAHVSGRNM